MPGPCRPPRLVAATGCLVTSPGLLPLLPASGLPGFPESPGLGSCLKGVNRAGWGRPSPFPALLPYVDPGSLDAPRREGGAGAVASSPEGWC